MQPLVSVLIPTYKRSNFIARALDSVLAQTYPRIEIVVVDDNIPESAYHISTKEALAPYVARKQIKYVKTAGATGGGAARNFGLQFCTGEYIAFLDDDDRYLPNKIEAQLQFMLEHDLEMSYQDVQWHDENDKLVELRKMDRAKDFSKQTLLRTHIVTAIAPTAIYMIRRDALMRTDGFGEVPRGQDFILMLRCIEADLKIGYMPGSYVVQYLHAGERISVGANFVQAQRGIYDLMCSYKPILSRQERRYVDFRFHAVCAFAYARGKQLAKAIPFAAKAFFISPVSCFKEAKRYLSGHGQN